MIGKGNYNTYYTSQNENDVEIAPIGNTYNSKTLAPNIYRDYSNGISLIDMAGYQDNRNYVGVIGVSYFLKAVV